MPERVDWHTYFMNIAHQAATRSTCDRKHVGAVIVRDKTILSTGYNGSIRGMPHCDDVGHLMEDGHCVATVHAEANAASLLPSQFLDLVRALSPFVAHSGDKPLALMEMTPIEP